MASASVTTRKRIESLAPGSSDCVGFLERLRDMIGICGKYNNRSLGYLAIGFPEGRYSIVYVGCR